MSQYLPNELLFQIALDLEFQDLIHFCEVSPQHQAICQDLSFWRERERRHSLNVEEFLYLKKLIKKNVEAGCEEVLDPDLCLKYAYRQGKYDLIPYFLEREATGAIIIRDVATSGDLALFKLVADSTNDESLIEAAYYAAMADRWDNIRYILHGFDLYEYIYERVLNMAFRGAIAGNQSHLIDRLVSDYTFTIGSSVIAAAKDNDEEMVRRLLELNKEISERDAWSAAEIAIRHDNLQIVKYLIKWVPESRREDLLQWMTQREQGVID